MVSTSSILAVCITLCISLIFPVIVFIVFGLKNRGQGIWSAWLLGAAGFFIFQFLIRLPIINSLSQNPQFLSFAVNNYVLYSFCMALTAALFEAAGRYIVAKLLHNNLTYKRGIAAGLGHGGIEAMLLIGTMYINNLVYMVMINSGSFDTAVAQTAALGGDTSSMLAAKEIFISSGPTAYLLSGYERLMTMIFHVALSLLVCYFVSKKKDLIGIAICVACHCAVDFVAPIVSGMASVYLGNKISQTTSYIIIYAFLTIVAVLSLLAIRHISSLWPNKN